MTTATETTKATEAAKHLFIRDTYEGGILVARPEWFETMKACQLYNQHGILVDNEHEEDPNDEDSSICNCEEVRAYNFFNGSNWQSVVIDAPYDTRYEEITDEDQIAKYESAIAKMDEPAIQTTGIDTYKVDGLLISESIWQGAWELYTITEDDHGSCPHCGSSDDEYGRMGVQCRSCRQQENESAFMSDKLSHGNII